MSIRSAFFQFCNSILLDNFDEMKTTVGEITKKLNKHYYGLSSDDSSHMYIVGSVGRETAIRGASDLDIIFDLPESSYTRFDKYESNGQSALLQEVKAVLKERYPKTDISGDGQVIVMAFTQYVVELVPGFKKRDNTFIYPDTHNGGNWKITDPLSEQEECQKYNQRTNGHYKRFCHIIRALRNKQGFAIGGLLIDTLVYNHFKCNNDYIDSSYSDYFDILKELLQYMKSQDKNQLYWSAIGSNQHVYNTDKGAWISKIDDAYSIIKDEPISSPLITKKLRDLLGSAFPEDVLLENGTKQQFTPSATEEQFIDQLFPVDIKYLLHIECKITQDGWRPVFLRELLRKHIWLNHNKTLDFYIEYCNCPPPYSIYWKVRNVGPEAEKRNMIRGQIVKTDLSKHREKTSFYGPHYVECFIVKNGVCMAKDRIDVPINWS